MKIIKPELKFIVAVGVSNKLEKWLAAQGFDVKTVRDIDPRISDHEIVKIASAVALPVKEVRRRRKRLPCLAWPSFRNCWKLSSAMCGQKTPAASASI